jgi:hypothetical protein
MLEETEGIIKNGQGHSQHGAPETERRKTKLKHNTEN